MGNIENGSIIMLLNKVILIHKVSYSPINFVDVLFIEYKSSQESINVFIHFDCLIIFDSNLEGLNIIKIHKADHNKERLLIIDELLEELGRIYSL